MRRSARVVSSPVTCPSVPPPSATRRACEPKRPATYTLADAQHHPLASATFRLPLILGPRALDCLPLEVGRRIRAAAGDKTHPAKSEPLGPQPDPIVREWRYATDPLGGSKSMW